MPPPSRELIEWVQKHLRAFDKAVVMTESPDDKIKISMNVEEAKQFAFNLKTLLNHAYGPVMPTGLMNEEEKAIAYDWLQGVTQPPESEILPCKPWPRM
jgi:hypothetical protein